MALIEILLAAYMGEKYIGIQLESIFKQSFKDFTITVSDDGSSDKTIDIVNSYIRLYPDKIRLIRRVLPTKSAGENFFELLAAAKKNIKSDNEKRYFMLSDQDDVWHPDKIKKTYLRMQALEKKYSRDMPCLVHTNLSLVDEKLNIIHFDMARYMGFKSSNTSLNRLLVENNITGNTVMLNAAFLNNYKRPGIKKYVMHDWWLALSAACIGKISYLDEALILYRQHSKNTLGARNALSFEVLKKRIGNKTAVQENYRLMYAQAEELLKKYNPDASKKRLLKEFTGMQKKNRAYKIAAILKNRFCKSGFITTVGEMFNI